MNEGGREGGGRPEPFWQLTTPVVSQESDSSLSPRGFFWIGWAAGFLNALVCVAVVLLFRRLLS